MSSTTFLSCTPFRMDNFLRRVDTSYHTKSPGPKTYTIVFGKTASR
jgi:hypothetical protein